LIVDMLTDCEIEWDKLEPHLGSFQRAVIETDNSFRETTDSRIKQEKAIEVASFIELEKKDYVCNIPADQLELEMIFPVSRQANLNHRYLKLGIIRSGKMVKLLKIHRNISRGERKFEFTQNQIIIHYDPDLEDLLEIAGLLSYYPSITLKNDIPSAHNYGKFEAIEFKYRRYYIEKILKGRLPSKGFRFLDQMKVLPAILPEVTDGKGLSQNRFHQYDIYDHLIESCDGVVFPDFVLRFSALLHDIGKVPTRQLKDNGEASFYNHEVVSSKMVVAIMKRFGIPKEVGLRIRFFVRNHMFHYTDEWTDKAIRRFLRTVSTEDLKNLIILRMADRMGSGKKNPFPKKLLSLIRHVEKVIEEDQRFKVSNLAFSGKDLLTMGLTEGPQIGVILRQLMAEVVENGLPNEFDILKEKAQKLISESEALEAS